MTTALKLRRGTTAQHASFTGAVGEVTVDTDKKTVVVHDGATAGGAPLMKETGTADTKFRIDSSGRVGIGTSSPTDELQVYKNSNGTTTFAIENPNAGTSAAARVVLSPETGAAYFTAGSSTNTGAAITGGASGAGLYTSSSLTNGLSVGTTTGPLKLFAGSTSTERMRITSAGEVLIGGTTSILAGTGLTIQNTTSPELSLFRDDTTVATSNAFGTIGFYGNDTTSNTPTQHAYIQAISSGTHAAGDNPTDILFATTPDGSATVAEAVRIKDGGGLQISRTAVTSPATGDGNVFSGTYTPTQVSTNTNVTSVTYNTAQYMRVGSVVTVSGRVDITATATGNTVVQFSLPIASNFAATSNGSGTGAQTSGTVANNSFARLSAQSTDDCILFQTNATVTTSSSYFYTFTYRII